MSTGRFRLQPPNPEATIGDHTSVAPDFQFVNFHVHADPTPRPFPVGTLQHDLASSSYTHEWKSWPDFKAWLEEEQRKNGIEFQRVKVYPGTEAYESLYALGKALAVSRSTPSFGWTGLALRCWRKQRKQGKKGEDSVAIGQRNVSNLLNVITDPETSRDENVT
ncbi:hypothetical protein B0H11DRAFT_1935757 [Mycena galericulata]|nr:hypothetical protein B0H11DRAFT_1935757 [Mycena galericulata]